MYKKFYFGDLTPCFNDLGVMGTVHLVVLLLAVLRLTQLFKPANEKVRTRWGFSGGCCGFGSFGLLDTPKPHSEPVR
jgi:hypothetical protein